MIKNSKRKGGKSQRVVHVLDRITLGRKGRQKMLFLDEEKGAPFLRRSEGKGGKSPV